MKRFLSSELAVIIVIISLATMAMAVLNPILPLFLTSINVVPSLIGLMLATGMVGMVFGEPSGGWLADKIGPKMPMSVGTLLCAPLVLSFVFVTSVPSLFLVFLFWGIVRAAVLGPALGYIGNTATLSNKATIVAIYMTSLTASRSLGWLISGIIADRASYDWDFYVSAGISLLAGILVFAGLRKMRLRKPALKGVGPVSPPAAAGQQPLDYRPVVVQCVIATLLFMVIGVNSFLPLLAVQEVGLEATQVGILYTAGGLVSMMLYVPLGRLADRTNKKALIMAGPLLSASSLAGLAFAREYALLILLVVIIYIGFAMFTPAAIALLSNNVPAYWQSTAMGVYGASEDMGVIIGSGVGGFVWTAGGPEAVFLMASAAALIGALICLGFIRDTTAGKTTGEKVGF